MNKPRITYRVSRITILLFLIFTAAACNTTPTMTINGHKLDIEIVDTNDERRLGLSNRDSMPENHGMLFVFENEIEHSFWMKDMRFDLDFIWIKDEKVVQITPNVSKNSTEIYKPNVPVDSVLEVNAGWITEKGVRVGDSIDLTR